MEETNNQDDTMEINNDVGNVDESRDIEEEENDYVDDQWYKLNDDTFHCLKNNAPTITVVCIDLQDDGCFFNSIDWKVDGSCISNNTHLKMLRIYFKGRCLGRPHGQSYILGEQGNELPTKQQLQDFFSCIRRNRSIEWINIRSVYIGEFGGDLIEGLSGHPSLNRLEIGNGRLRSIGCEALGKVLKHPESKLNDLRLPGCDFDDEGLSALCNGLVGLGNNTLKKLDLSGNKFTSIGWRALSTVLQHPNCKLIELGLHHAEINDDGSNILENVSSSLKNLGFTYNKSISKEAWKTFLKSSQSLHLDLVISEIDEDSLTVLIDNIGILKSLDLGENKAITPTIWQSFFNSLQTSGTQLKEFNIRHAKVGNVGATALGSFLRSSAPMLKKLSIDFVSSSRNDSDSISSQGWVSLFSSLQDNTNLNLSSLSLHENKIDDEGLQLLVQMVSSMKSLKFLDLYYNDLVTPTGWQVLSDYLQSNCSLKELYLHSNNINDDTLVEFTNALRNNKSLKYLDVGDSPDDDGHARITQRGWAAVSTLLCNKTSIMDTYNSNHILQDPGDYAYPEDAIPNHLVESLKLNENKDKVEVARQKILRTHFSSDATSKVQEFLDMKLEVIPTAIAWIGRPTVGWVGREVSRLSLMYNLMRRLPDLFDSSAQQKKQSAGKRKHTL